jgi:GntR family transcriptional regulator
MTENSRVNSTQPYHPVIPLHFQIQRVLRAEVESGKWPVGQLVPPELKLMRRFGVSRTTIRRALRWLESDGLIARHRGKGTFVLASGNRQNRPRGVKSLLLGYRAEIQVIDVRTVDCPADIAIFLKVKAGELVREFKRLEIVEGEPLAVVLNYVRFEVGQRITASELKKFSMLEILRDRLRLKLGVLRQSIAAALPDEAVALLLESDVSQPVLAVRLIVHDQKGQPIQVCDAFYRGNSYCYEVEAQLPPNANKAADGIVDSRPARVRRT